MKTPSISKQTSAFTKLELLVVIIVLAVLYGLMAPRRGTRGVKAQRIKCASNLKQIGLSFMMYAGDHDGRLPWKSAYGPDPSLQKQMVWQYFQTISNELGSTKILMCPGDVIRQPNLARDFSDGPEGLVNSSNRNNAVSYLLGIFASTNQYNALLVGDRNLAKSEQSLPYDSRVTNPVEVTTTSVWSSLPGEALHDDEGNYILADGSIQYASNDRLQEALRLARQSYGTNANLFLFPQ